LRTPSAKRLVLFATTAAVAVAGVGTAANAAPAAPAAPGPVSSITWGACTDPDLVAAGAQCGYLSVPLNYSKPNGAKIQLAVSRVKHTVPDKQYQGIMLVNPGGPGGSGLSLSTLGSAVPKNGGAPYDWIGFDPRGVGSSKPALSCDPYYFAGPRPEYVPWTSQLEKTWLSRSKGYADACAKNGGELLNNLTTIDSAKDMDMIRAALGEKQINYYGFSYGTYLAQVYGTLYPERVRRMVLDGNVDPRDVWYQANLNQDVAFQGNIEIWFGWLAKYDSVYHLGTTQQAVAKKFYAAKEATRSAPIGGTVGPDEWTDIFLYAGYYQIVWLSLADALATWINDKDPAGVLAWYENAESPGDDNGFAIYAGVQCTDVQWPQSWNKWKIDNWLTYLKAPYETWGNAWFNAPCLYWKGQADKPAKVDGKKVPGILLVSETLDAATPYEGSLEVRRRFPKAALIGEPGGTTHAGTLYGNDCVDNQIADYLLTGKLPARKSGDRADSVCAPLPQPDPTAAAAKAKANTLTTTTNGRAPLFPVRH
jgi:pimeloyl-ACP methyl ester carboxylesterase